MEKAGPEICRTSPGWEPETTGQIAASYLSPTQPRLYSLALAGLRCKEPCPDDGYDFQPCVCQACFLLSSG